MKVRTTFFALLFAHLAFCQAPKFDWVTQEGNGSEDFGWKIRRATNGDLYVAIGFQGSTTVNGTVYTQVGATNYDFLICKYNNAGVFQWAKQLYEIDGQLDFPRIEIDGADNLYVFTAYSSSLTFDGSSYTPIAGTSNSYPYGIFGAKLSNAGSVLWAKNLITIYRINASVTADVHSSGKFILTTYMKDSVKIGSVSDHANINGSNKTLFAEFNSAGNEVWHTIDPNYKYTRDIKYDYSGSNFYIAGTYSGTVSFVAGPDVTVSTNGSQDVFLAKYQGGGFAYCSWAKSIGSSTDDNYHGLEVGNNNVNIIASMSSSGSISGNSITVGTRPKLVNTLFDGSGSCVYASGFADGTTFIFQGFDRDNAGNVYLSGGFNDSISLLNNTLYSSGGRDALIIKLNEQSGNAVWSRSWGGIGDDIVRAVANTENELYATGSFSGTITFGNMQFTALGLIDPFVAKLSGCDFPLVNVTYNGSTALCNGQVLTLNSNLIQGAHYQWLKDNVVLPGDTASSLTVAGAGSYSLDVNMGGACRDTFGAVTVTTSLLNATIQSVQPSICAGGTLQLYTNLPYNSYSWSTGVSTPTVTIGQQGTYTVIVTDGSGCLDTASVTIGEFPQPTTPIVLVGNDCQLASSVVISGYSYKWRLNGNVVGGNSAYLDATQFGNGFYTIEITDGNGCKATSTTPVSVTCPTGIEEPTLISDLKIYPNPNSGLFNILLKTQENNVEIVFSDLLGHSVLYKQFELNNGELNAQFNFSAMAKGLYIMRINANGKSMYRKINLTK